MMKKNKHLIGISGKKQSGKDTIGNIIDYLVSIKNPDFNNLHYKEIFVKNYEKAMLSVGSFSGYKKVKFADKLKDMVCLLLNCTREQLEDREFKEKELGEEWWKYELSWHEYGKVDGVYNTYEEACKELRNFGGSSFDEKEAITTIKLTPRLLLQLLGTECGRKIIHPDIWVNATMSEYKPQHFRTVKNNGLFSHQEMIYPKWIITDVRFPNEAKAIKDRNGILIRVNRNPIGMLNKVNYTYPIQGTLKHVNNELQLVPHESETALDNYENWDYVIDNNGSIPDLVKKVKDILIKEEIIK